MNLGKHIDSLLIKHPSIFVKGLGVFKRVHHPATFYEKKNVFLPPISFIEFECTETTEAFDFVNYIQDVEQITRLDAESKLEIMVNSIVDNIFQNGEVFLDSLGTLVSHGNAYVFKPLDSSGFHYLPVENDFVQSSDSNIQNTNSNISVGNQEPRLDIDQAVEVSEVDSSLGKSENNNKNESLLTENFTESSKEDSVNVRGEEDIIIHKESSYYIYGLLASLVILLVAGLYYYITLQQNNKPIPSVSPKIENIAPVDSTLIDSLNVNDTINTLKDTVISDKEIVTTTDKNSSNYKYIIVLATHHNLENANLETEKYNKAGYKSVRVLEPNVSTNKKRVIWDAYTTREQRDSALRIVRKQIKDDAWGTEI